MLSSNDREGKTVLIFACSGGSNVGQISNEAAKKLTADGVGRFFCLAGVGGDISGIIETTKAADEVIVIDGCSVACAKAIIDKIDVPINCYIDATKLGIEKAPHLDFTDEEINTVCDAVTTCLEGGDCGCGGCGCS